MLDLHEVPEQISARFLLEILAKVLPCKNHDSDAVLGSEGPSKKVTAEFEDSVDYEIVRGDEQLADVLLFDVDGAQVRVLQQQVHDFTADVGDEEVGVIFRVQGRREQGSDALTNFFFSGKFGVRNFIVEQFDKPKIRAASRQNSPVHWKHSAIVESKHRVAQQVVLPEVVQRLQPLSTDTTIATACTSAWLVTHHKVLRVSTAALHHVLRHVDIATRVAQTVAVVASVADTVVVFVHGC